MNTLVLIALALVAILAGVVLFSHARGFSKTPGILRLANFGTGFVQARTSYLTDSAIVLRYSLVKRGHDDSHIVIAEAGDVPLGIATDEANAAERLISVDLFGLKSEGAIGNASGAIADQAFLVSAAAGKVRTLPAATGTYYIIGRALKAAADGETVDYVPCFPTQRVVA